MSTKINYAMTRDYRSEWGIIEALRELAQNCVDNREHESTYEARNVGYTGTVNIITKGFVLPLNTLALGVSEKPNGAIGGFGEGLKLAMLILTRAGCCPVLVSGDNVITGGFELHPILGVETFCLTVGKTDKHVPMLHITCNIPPKLIPELQQKVTMFSDNPLPVPTGAPELLPELLPDIDPGHIYVGGLWVCEMPHFKYSYNFPPDQLELGCDRKVASDYGVAWHTTKTWINKLNEDPQLVLELLTSDAIDVAYFENHCTPDQAKTVTTAFVERFGAVTIKQLGSSLSYGMSVGGSLYRTMQHGGYTEVANPWAEPETPYSKLEGFFKQHRSKLRRDIRQSFEQLLEESKSWKQ